MKIQLPNGKQHELDNGIALSEKIKVVEDLINEWKNEIEKNWESNSVRYFLDSLSNYLVWHKENMNSKEEDKEVMSKNKTNRLHRGRKDIPFSNLSNEQKDTLFGETRGDE